MHDRKLPTHDQLWSERMTKNAVRQTLQAIWEALQCTDRWQEDHKTHVYFAPNEGLFLFDDRWVHPSVVEILLRHHLYHIGFCKHQGETMVAYELAAKIDAVNKLCSFDEYMERVYDGQE